MIRIKRRPGMAADILRKEHDELAAENAALREACTFLKRQLPLDGTAKLPVIVAEPSSMAVARMLAAVRVADAAQRYFGCLAEFCDTEEDGGLAACSEYFQLLSEADDAYREAKLKAEEE